MTFYRPDPKLARSDLDISDPVAAADFPEIILRYRNDRAAALVGLDDLSDSKWIAHFGRFTPLPDNQPEPLALRYHGHQFRQYNPDLGDGRGFLFAQLRDDKDRLLDLGTKGSGTTPWSRGGDGRLTLKGGVREVLATTLLEALGVNTSRTFSLIETGEALHRGDEPSPTRSSVLVRLSHSHIRFGTFERLAYLGDKAGLNKLVAYVIDTYYPQAADAVALYDAVITAKARTTAQWMAAGFVHGVLNTDNMNITGESFDYGPYRFLPHYDPGFTAAYFDRTGLYAYGRQPDAVNWNLAQLGNVLTLVAEPSKLIEHYNAFAGRYQSALHTALLARLNLKPMGEDTDAALFRALYAFLTTLKADGSFEGVIYDAFCRRLNDQSPRSEGYRGEAFDTFKTAYDLYEVADESRLHHPRLALPDPETLLIDEIEAIWADIAERDDWSTFNAKIAAIDTYGDALGLTPKPPHL